MNRRLAAMGKDEYDTLRPVADLRRELRDRIYNFIQSPLQWEGPVPTEEEMQTKFDALADNLSGRLLALATRRVWRERIKDWERAYQESGHGLEFRSSAHHRERHLRSSRAGPGRRTPTPDRNQFLREVVGEVEGAAEEIGAWVL